MLLLLLIAVKEENAENAAVAVIVKEENDVVAAVAVVEQENAIQAAVAHDKHL